MKSCIPCPPGKYAPDEGSTECSLCKDLRGGKKKKEKRPNRYRLYYQDAPGQAQCKPCLNSDSPGARGCEVTTGKYTCWGLYTWRSKCRKIEDVTTSVVLSFFSFIVVVLIILPFVFRSGALAVISKVWRDDIRGAISFMRFSTAKALEVGAALEAEAASKEREAGFAELFDSLDPYGSGFVEFRSLCPFIVNSMGVTRELIVQLEQMGCSSIDDEQAATSSVSAGDGSESSSHNAVIQLDFEAMRQLLSTIAHYHSYAQRRNEYRQVFRELQNECELYEGHNITKATKHGTINVDCVNLIARLLGHKFEKHQLIHVVQAACNDEGDLNEESFVDAVTEAECTERHTKVKIEAEVIDDSYDAAFDQHATISDGDATPSMDWNSFVAACASFSMVADARLLTKIQKKLETMMHIFSSKYGKARPVTYLEFRLYLSMMTLRCSRSVWPESMYQRVFVTKDSDKLGFVAMSKLDELLEAVGVLSEDTKAQIKIHCDRQDSILRYDDFESSLSIYHFSKTVEEQIFGGWLLPKAWRTRREAWQLFVHTIQFFFARPAFSVLGLLVRFTVNVFLILSATYGSDGTRAKMQEIEAGLEIACVEILRVGNMLNITRGFHFLSNFLLQCTAVIQPNFMDVEGGVTCEGKASSKYKFSNWL